MHDILRNTFQATLDREGKEITINKINKKVFFRRNETGSTTSYTTLFAPVEADIRQGQIFDLKGSKHLITKALTNENEVYRKYQAVKCNAQIKWMFNKDDLVIFDAYMKDIADSLNTNKNGIIISSKLEIWIPLTKETKRIKVNNRFFCGSYHMPWKIIDLNYNDNCLLAIYAERTPNLPSDNAKEGIVNYYDYYKKSSEYKVVFDMHKITVEELEDKLIDITIYKDGVLIENPVISEKFIELDGSLIPHTDDMTVDEKEIITKEYLKISTDNENVAVRIENNQLKILGIKKGACKITALYSTCEEDTSVSDTIEFVIKEKAVEPTNIEIIPAYTHEDYFYLKQGRTQTFQVDINGVKEQKWCIQLNSNGIAENRYFTADIDNENGKFTVKNIEMNNKEFLVFYVKEETSGKTDEYRIKLASMF